MIFARRFRMERRCLVVVITSTLLKSWPRKLCGCWDLMLFLRSINWDRTDLQINPKLSRRVAITLCATTGPQQQTTCCLTVGLMARTTAAMHMPTFSPLNCPETDDLCWSIPVPTHTQRQRSCETGFAVRLRTTHLL